MEGHKDWKDWKEFEQNNKTIALNILYVPHNTKIINLAYKSKYNRKRKNQVVLLMIINGKQSDEIDKWHYIALKSGRTDNGFNRPIRSLSRLFRGITSNNNGYFYHGEKALKLPYTFYADFECLPIKQQSCQNNPEESYTERKAIHKPCGYSSDLVSSFDSKQDKHSVYRRKDCTKKNCKDFKRHVVKIINFKEKDMIPLIDE